MLIMPFASCLVLASLRSSYACAQASRASVMTILEIPFAYLLQSLLFHDDVTPLGLVGVALVVCGTMLNLLRQMSRKTRGRNATEPSDAAGNNCAEQ